MIDKTRAQNEAPHQCTGVQEALGEKEPENEPSVPEIFQESKKYRLEPMYPIER